MTVIAAAIDRDGTIFMGGDGMGVSGTYGARPNNRSKVFTLGEFIIGASGPVQIGQAIEHLFVPPPLGAGDDLVKYAVTKLSPALRTLMKETGGEIKDANGVEGMDGRLLVGIRGHLFTLDSGYAPLESPHPFAAIGCADQEALAAMFTAKKLLPDLSAREIVQCGLEAAAEFDLAIRGPFTILSSAKPVAIAAVA